MEALARGCEFVAGAMIPQRGIDFLDAVGKSPVVGFKLNTVNEQESREIRGAGVVDDPAKGIPVGGGRRDGILVRRYVFMPAGWMGKREVFQIVASNVVIDLRGYGVWPDGTVCAWSIMIWRGRASGQKRGGEGGRKQAAP